MTTECNQFIFGFHPQKRLAAKSAPKQPRREKNSHGKRKTDQLHNNIPRN